MSFDSYEDSVVDSVHNPTGYYTETDEFGNDTGSGYSSPDSGGLYQNHTPSPAWSPAWPTGVNPAFHNEPFIQQKASEGWARDHLNSMGAQLFQDRANAQNLAPHEQSIQNQIDVKPISFDIPTSPFDYSKHPTGQNPNFNTIVNPYVPTDAIKGSFNSIINPTGQQIAAVNAQAAAGQQTANWVRGKFFGAMPFDDPKPGWDAKRKQFRSDIGEGIKTGIEAVGEGVGNWWDNMNADDANKVDPVEPSVGNTPTTPTQPTENTYLTPANIEKYNDIMKQDKARGTDTLYNQGPQGVGGTSFSEDRWKDIAKAAQVKSSTNNGLMDSLTQAYNTDYTKGIGTSQMTAHLNNKTMTDAIDLSGKSDKEIVEMINSIGYENTIHAKSYEPYGEPGVVTMFGVPMGEAQDSYKPIYSDEDAALISRFRREGKTSDTPTPRYTGGSNKMGFPDPYTGQVQAPTIEHRESYGIEPMTLTPEQQNNFVNVALTVHPSGWVALFGKKAAKYIEGVVSRAREPGLTKIANKPVNRVDDLLTVTEQGLMKPAVRNKVGLGTHTPKELGTINRNAPIQGENIYTNSKILGNRNRLNANSIPVRARK